MTHKPGHLNLGISKTGVHMWFSKLPLKSMEAYWFHLAKHEELFQWQKLRLAELTEDFTDSIDEASIN